MSRKHNCLMMVLLVISTACQSWANLPNDEKTKQMALAQLPPEKRLCQGKEPAVTRIVQPGDVYTEEYLPDRLTIRLDETGKVIEAGCQ